jgi:hypothetical protein
MVAKLTVRPRRRRDYNTAMRYRLRTLLIVLALGPMLLAVVAMAVALAVSSRQIARESIRLENERIMEEKFRPYMAPQPVNPAIPYESDRSCSVSQSATCCG